MSTPLTCHGCNGIDKAGLLCVSLHDKEAARYLRMLLRSLGDACQCCPVAESSMLLLAAVSLGVSLTHSFTAMQIIFAISCQGTPAQNNIDEYSM